MKNIVFILVLINAVNCLAQENSDLYNHIDSLIQIELKYIPDSTTDQLPSYEWDSTIILIPNFSTFPANPFPLIILDGKKINMEELNRYKLRKIEYIHIYKKDDLKMRAIYGTSSKNGTVIIQSIKAKGDR